MSLKAWNEPIYSGDYHYIRLSFSHTSENINPSIRFAVYNPSLQTWIKISNISSPSSYNTNHYIKENSPVNNTSGSASFFMTWQSTETIQTPSDALIKSTYTVLDCDTITPNIYYFPIYWIDGIDVWQSDCLKVTTIDPFNVIIPIAPCFSGLTYKTLLKYIPKLSQSMIVTQSYRGDKKMFRCKIHPYGILEFTHDHPFLYNNKLYTFEELTKIHPSFRKTCSEIPFDDLNCGKMSKIYNVIGCQEQYNTNNIFDMGKNLKVIGGAMTPQLWKHQMDRVEYLISLSKYDRNLANSKLEKYTNIHDFIDNGDNYNEIEFIFGNKDEIIT